MTLKLPPFVSLFQPQFYPSVGPLVTHYHFFMLLAPEACGCTLKSGITVLIGIVVSMYVCQGVHCSLQSKRRLVHSFLNIQEAQVQNMRSIGPYITLQRDQNQNLWPSAADRPNLAVLKLSRAEPLQPYFWTNFSEILVVRSLGYMDSLGLSPFWSKVFLKIGKHPNVCARRNKSTSGNICTN